MDRCTIKQQEQGPVGLKKVLWVWSWCEILLCSSGREKTRQWCDRFCFGTQPIPTRGCWQSLTFTASVPFFRQGAEDAYQRWKYVGACVLFIYWHSSPKKAPLACRRCETPCYLHVVPIEGMGHHTQGRHETPLRKAGLQLHAMEKGLGESP